MDKSILMIESVLDSSNKINTIVGKLGYKVSSQYGLYISYEKIIKESNDGFKESFAFGLYGQKSVHMNFNFTYSKKLATSPNNVQINYYSALNIEDIQEWIIFKETESLKVGELFT